MVTSTCALLDQYCHPTDVRGKETLCSRHGQQDPFMNPSPTIGLIGLITVFDAILPGRQSGQKLQCLYGNRIFNKTYCI